MSTKVDTYQQQRDSVEGGWVRLRECPRHGCRGQAPWTGLRRLRNRTHPAIQETSCCCCCCFGHSCCFGGCRAQPCQTPTFWPLPATTATAAPACASARATNAVRRRPRRCARPARRSLPACAPPPRGSPAGHAPPQRAHGSGRKPKPTPSHCSFSLLAMSGTVSISCPINRPTVRGSSRRAESETAIAQCSTSCSRPSTPSTLANGCSGATANTNATVPSGSTT